MSAALIGSVLPDWCAARESRTDEVYEREGLAPLYPAEAEAVAKAVPKRQREFTTVRLCAREALAELGQPPVPLLPGKRGKPGWPAGVVGSMTHCAGYRAAVVARAEDAVSLGIDAEPDEPLPEGVLEAVSLPVERRRLTVLDAARPGVAWGRLLFSAKESVFKTWYPLTGRELGFEEAELAFDMAGRDRGTFTARLLVPGPQVNGAAVGGFTGRWVARDGLLATAIVLTADPRP